VTQGKTLGLLLLIGAATACGPEVPSPVRETAQEPGSPAPTETATFDDAGGGASAAPPPPSTPSSPVVDSDAVLASIALGAYQTSPSFTEVTSAPYPSVAAPGSMIREWVSTPALGVYEAVSPGVSGSNVIAPVGATIVRAVLGEDGGVDKLTLMYKGPAGYNPALGDWWFGVTDPSGTPLESDGGAEVGLLSTCYSCHVPRSTDDYLFGVPLDDRVATEAGDDAGAGTGASDGAADDAGDSGADDAGTDSGHHHH
jgi:hypothetical protein